MSKIKSITYSLFSDRVKEHKIHCDWTFAPKKSQYLCPYWSSLLLASPSLFSWIWKSVCPGFFPVVVWKPIIYKVWRENYTVYRVQEFRILFKSFGSCSRVSDPVQEFRILTVGNGSDHNQWRERAWILICPKIWGNEIFFDIFINKNGFS